MKVHQKEKKRAKFRVSFIFLFIILSFTVCFYFYMKGDFDASKSASAGNDESVLAVFDNFKNTEKKVINPVQKSKPKDKSYFKDIFFIGDNRMSGMYNYGIIAQENMLLSDSLSVSDINNDSIPECKTVYFMIGMNDIDKIEDESVFDNLGNVIDALTEKGKTDIYLVSLLPVSAKYESDNPGVSNTMIDSYNSALLRFANSKNVYYLDLNTMFVGNDGKLQESKTEANGVRLTKNAYEEIGEYILNHIGE